MTFSIVGRCAKTGQLGIAISSSSIAVGARCPWLRAGVGAVSTQNITLPALGPQVLDQLALGLSPEQALASVPGYDRHSRFRQVTVIDHLGQTAIFNGAETLGCVHSVAGEQCVGAGNMLAHTGVIDALVQAFETTPGTLPDRLIAAMQAALAAGGEAGPVHSAALKAKLANDRPARRLGRARPDRRPCATLGRLPPPDAGLHHPRPGPDPGAQLWRTRGRMNER
jgi:uncharacterized Ntn-hydrolase superfamily protein